MLSMEVVLVLAASPASSLPVAVVAPPETTETFLCTDTEPGRGLPPAPGAPGVITPPVALTLPPDSRLPEGVRLLPETEAEAPFP